MDLSRNTYRHSNKKQKRRSHSIDDDDIDNISNNSRSSYNIHTTSLASDSESSVPVSVREMIKLYNSAAKENAKLPAVAATSTAATARRNTASQHALPMARSAYFGVNKFGSQTNVRQFVTQLQETGEENGVISSKPTTIHQSLKLKKRDNCGGSGYSYRQRHNSVRSSNEAQSESDSNKMFYIADHTQRSSRSPNRESQDFKDSKESNDLKNISTNLKTVASQDRNSLQASDSIDESHYHPIESSYQSKTTIAKTSSGVRIIIDIFFDQEQQNVSATDVVGSRVETDIPQSRILSEFQQQATVAAAATQSMPQS